jgi:hypothetical protein
MCEATSCVCGATAGLQALQLLLLRRYAQHVLGPLTSRALPELLLADGSRCCETAAMLLLRELQAITSAPQEPLSSGEVQLWLLVTCLQEWQLSIPSFSAFGECCCRDTS